MTAARHQDPAFPERHRRWLARLHRHWQRRGARLYVLPPSGPSRAGFSTSEVPALIVAERQQFGLTWPGGSYSAEEDDVILTPQDRAHRHDWDDRRRRHPALVIMPFHEDIVFHQRNAPPERWSHTTWRHAAGTGPALDAALDLVTRLHESPVGQSAWAQEVIRETIAHALSMALHATAAPQRASRGGPAIAVRCRNYLRHALADPSLDVPTIAAALGYDARSLGQHYRWETGETLRATLCLLRVQRARRRPPPIAEIAGLCGFASASHFSRTFTRIEGYPPRRYRRYGHLEEEEKDADA